MIEFNGYITGKAEKYFFQRSRNIGMAIMTVAAVSVLSPIAFFAISRGNMKITIACGTILVFMVLIPLIPKGKKEKLSLIPKKIYTDGESITCIGDKFVESKLIGEEKEVRDHGEFYEIVYPFGKVSEKFICQKTLLTKGTLEDFEALFEGKIKIIEK